MDEPVLQVTKKKYAGESSVISMRLPRDMVKDLDKIAADTGRTRNELLTMSIEFALNHMEIQQENENLKEGK